jgi:hypothetical protein
MMLSQNTPKIAAILEKHQLSAIPEAHCFLKYDNHTLGITFPEPTEFIVVNKLEYECEITPQQIGAFKIAKHQEFIKAWLKDKSHLNFDLIWSVREKCINELSR